MTKTVATSHVAASTRAAEVPDLGYTPVPDILVFRRA